ncbi:MAG: hypothetical protein FVQ82_07490 [Planctomycetes bacterium]|nr:hypothetical protein [Planctomycetota bacterium]
MSDNKSQDILPKIALDFIDSVVKKVRYRKKIRQEVRDELTDHFYMALKDCKTDQEKLQAAEEVISEFGEVNILGSLIRHGKKRCRPLWKKVIVTTMKVIGVLLLLAVLRTGYMVIGTPVISVDYLEWLNDHVSKGRDESLNAYPYYKKAAKLGAVEIPEAIETIMWAEDGIEGDDIELVKEFLVKMEPAFSALREGASKPYNWPRYEIDPEAVSEIKAPSELSLTTGLIGSVIPFMGDAKKLALRMSQLQIPVKLHEGDIDGALDDSLVLCNFGRHMTGTGLLIEQLVGIAIHAIGIECINDAIKNKNISASALSRCQKHMEKFEKDAGHVLNLNAEKVFQYDYIQHTFTDDGSGNGRALFKGLPAAVRGNKEIVSGFILGNYPDRRAVTESIESFYEEAERIMNIPPWQLSDSEVETIESSMLEDLGYLIRDACFVLLKTRPFSWRLIAEHRSIIMVCAVLRYEKDKGELPADSKVLVSGGYLEKLPVDPFSGEPFVYKRTDEGFLLYSFGTDMDDDGGNSTVTRDGKPRKWFEGDGDAVFWSD